MNKLQIYQEEKTQLSPISFLNDVQNQTKIRNLDDVAFRNNLGFIVTKVNNLLGIKEEILDINKLDIKEMILMRFKGLSLNEIEFAFKLERFGTLNPKTEHFQLFNADYVSKVIDKYLKWKEFKLKNNIIKKVKYQEISKEEKIKKENDIVLRFINNYDKYKPIDYTYFYIYDILDSRDFMNKDLKYKESVKKDAIYLLEKEYSGKKASSRDELRDYKSKLKLVIKGIGGEVIHKCKILALEDFFRDLHKDPKKIIEFKNKFK